MKNITMLIRCMENEDILNVSRVHAEVFPRQMFSEQWITCNFNAFPRIRYYLAEINGEIVGYVKWTEKSGFRKEVVLGLEQIAVLSSLQKQGIGTTLISQSLPLMQEELEKGKRTSSIFWFQQEPTMKPKNSMQKL